MTRFADIEIGTVCQTAKPIMLKGAHRSRGVVVFGTPGAGKSSLMAEMFVQDVEAGMGGMFVDPHNNIQKILERLPVHRHKDVVLLSLVHDQTPALWPVLSMAREDDELLMVADLLIDAWRAQFGETSFGARGESILAHLLALVPRDNLSPIELLSALSFRDYRYKMLEKRDHLGMDFALDAFWNGTMRALNEAKFQEWAQSTANKLSRLLLHPYLRRSTTGNPIPIESSVNPRAPVALLKDADVERVMWLRDGLVAVWRNGNPHHSFVVISRELEPFLLDMVRNNVAKAPAFPRGMPAPGYASSSDRDDLSLTRPTEDEVATLSGDNVWRHVLRRRRRRAWARYVDFDLLRRGVAVKESIDISDLLDDEKIILVEVPEGDGSEVTANVATFALMSAVLRGTRQLALPENRQTPAVIYIDEAAKFISAGVERTLTELRKAGVALTLGIQRASQLGGPNAMLRRSVIDTVGTIICMPPGREESQEFADLLSVERDQLQALQRGEGYVATLTEGWAQEKPVKFTAKRLREVRRNNSATLRAVAVERYCQSAVDADAVYLERVSRIRRMAGGRKEHTSATIAGA
ncbi:MAG: type IV secretory system conjugative DNA transfer family protein [Candidatus Dormibacteria bacterium]